MLRRGEHQRTSSDARDCEIQQLPGLEQSFPQLHQQQSDSLSQQRRNAHASALPTGGPPLLIKILQVTWWQWPG